jgi:DnaK suppressor protein
VDPERAADLLARERARVENSLASLSTDAAEDSHDASVDVVPQDRAADLTRFETDEALSSRLRRELELIEEAEARLREGSYGISVVSGEEIPDERLEAVPWADRTVAEEEQS